jgi:hypothetical protein
MAAPTPSDVVNALNLRRSTTTGIWELPGGESDPGYEKILTQIAACVVAQQRAQQGSLTPAEVPVSEVDACVSSLRSSRPSALPAQLHLAVVVLAFLRKHASSQQGVWEGMQAKAVAHLEAPGLWPQAGSGVKSVAMSVMAVMKLM